MNSADVHGDPASPRENCRTEEVEALLHARYADVLASSKDPGAALLFLARRHG